MLSVAFFIVVLNVPMLSVIMLNVIMLSVVMLNVIMLSVVLLNAVALTNTSNFPPRQWYVYNI